MKFRILFFLWLFVVCPIHAQTQKLYIDSQQAFDQLDEKIKEALSKKTTIVEITFKKGVYYYNDCHINLYKVYKDKVSIVIDGNGAELRAKGKDIRPGQKGKDAVGIFDPDALYIYDDGEPLQFNTAMKSVVGKVTVVDKEKKKCKVRLPERVRSIALKDGYIYMTQWFHGSVYPITGISGKTVYFTADNLAENQLFYNVNNDWRFGMKSPRYCLINYSGTDAIHDYSLQAKRKGLVHRCDASEFLGIRGSHFDKIVIRNLVFNGNRYDKTDQNKNNLIMLYCSKINQSNIERCEFRNVRTDCIRIVFVNNVTVSDCVFSKCYRRCIRSQNGAVNTIVRNNMVSKSGLCGDNVAAIECLGEDFQVRNNRCEDFGYAAISTGVNFKFPKEHPVSGVIDGNEVYQTPAYFSSAPMNLLMDSGGIYITTQNDKVVVSNNYVHDINGPKANRGIFCDDGTFNVTISGNKVLNIRNSFPIDLRLVKDIETSSESKVKKVNFGNKVINNQVDAKIRVE